MIGRLCRSVSGTTSLEFAIVAPLLLAFLFGGTALGIAAWKRNILQEVALEASRCIALSSTTCGTVTQRCDSGVAGICYAELRARQLGLPDLSASQITVNPSVMINGVSFTTVTIGYPFRLAGYGMTLSTVGFFPNGG